MGFKSDNTAWESNLGHRWKGVVRAHQRRWWQCRLGKPQLGARLNLGRATRLIPLGKLLHFGESKSVTACLDEWTPPSNEWLNEGTELGLSCYLQLFLKVDSEVVFFDYQRVKMLGYGSIPSIFILLILFESIPHSQLWNGEIVDGFKVTWWLVCGLKVGWFSRWFWMGFVWYWWCVVGRNSVTWILSSVSMAYLI